MIRPVQAADAVAINNIYTPFILTSTVTFETAPLTIAEMEARIASISACYPYLVYEVDGKVLGYCYAHPWKERAAFAPTLETTIYLHPDAEGRGVGTAMMRLLIDMCRQGGARSLIACITAENSGSVAFHRSLGFEQVSLFKSVGLKFGRWLDVVDMQLML